MCSSDLVGLVRRQDFRRNLASARFSPRTKSNPIVRKLTWESTLDYITNNRNVLETRQSTLNFRSDFHNSDFITVTFGRYFERLDRPFHFALRDIPTGTILFLGRVADPTAK